MYFYFPYFYTYTYAWLYEYSKYWALWMQCCSKYINKLKLNFCSAVIHAPCTLPIVSLCNVFVEVSEINKAQGWMNLSKNPKLSHGFIATKYTWNSNLCLFLFILIRKTRRDLGKKVIQTFVWHKYFSNTEWTCLQDNDKTSYDKYCR